MIALLLALLAGSPSPSPAPRVTVTLSVRPWFAARAPVRATAILRIRDPHRLLAGCPSIAVEWGDGCRSENVVECLDPYAMPEASPTEIRRSIVHPYYTPSPAGESYRIRVTVSRGGRRLATAGGEITVEGLRLEDLER